MRVIRSERQQKALEYALDVIKESPVLPFVEGVYLYGSCARAAEKWTSDVDLFMELHPSFLERKDLRIPLRLLKSEVSSDELYNPEVDLKIVVGDDWRSSNMLYYQNVLKDGIQLCV